MIHLMTGEAGMQASLTFSRSVISQDFFQIDFASSKAEGDADVSQTLQLFVAIPFIISDNLYVSAAKLSNFKHFFLFKRYTSNSKRLHLLPTNRYCAHGEGLTSQQTTAASTVSLQQLNMLCFSVFFWA